MTTKCQILKYSWKITTEIIKCFELNVNKGKSQQILSDSSKAILTRKRITLGIYDEKEEMMKINDVYVYSKKLEYRAY